MQEDAIMTIATKPTKRWSLVLDEWVYEEESPVPSDTWDHNSDSTCDSPELAGLVNMR